MRGPLHPERERSFPDPVPESVPVRRRRPSAGALVLVVDDYPDTRDLLTMALREAGFRVAEAADGAVALELAWALTPDLILMDVSMPRLDGCAATEALKSDPRSKHIPVIAVTCHDLAGLADIARHVPFDAVVHKPCLPEDVAALAVRVLAEREIA